MALSVWILAVGSLRNPFLIYHISGEVHRHRGLTLCCTMNCTRSRKQFADRRSQLVRTNNCKIRRSGIKQYFQFVADLRYGVDIEFLIEGYQAIELALLRHRGRLGDAARELGISRVTLYRLLTARGMRHAEDDIPTDAEDIAGST